MSDADRQEHLPRSKKQSADLLGQLAIILFAVLGHGLLLLNDGIYWDDWVWFDLRQGTYHWDRVFDAAREMGSLPYEKYFAYLFSIFPDTVFAAKFFVFVAIVLGGLCAYRLAAHSGVLGELESVLIAILFVLYPGNRTQIALSTAFYQIYIALFLLACLFALREQSKRDSRRRCVALRFAAMGLFVLSFSLTSLVAYYLCFLVLLLCRRRSSEPPLEPFWRRAGRFLAVRLDYLLLPVVFLLVKFTFFHPTGYYEGYRQLELGIPSILSSMEDLIPAATYSQLTQALDLLRSKLIPWLPVPVTVYLAFLMLLVAATVVGLVLRSGNRRGLLRLGMPIAFALMLLAASLLPYALAGYTAARYGWDTRHLTLVGLPLAVLLVALLRVLFRSPNGHLSVAGAVALAPFIVGFLLVLNQSYLHWEVKWLKDQSVMRHIGNSSLAKKVSVFLVDDFYFPVYGDRAYQFYEWSGIFYFTNGTQTTVGLDRRLNPHPDNFLDSRGAAWHVERYNLRDFDPHGCQATLTIRPGRVSRGNSSIRLIYDYYRLKFFGRPEALDNYLLQVAEVDMDLVHSPFATHCSLY